MCEEVSSDIAVFRHTIGRNGLWMGEPRTIHMCAEVPGFMCHQDGGIGDVIQGYLVRAGFAVAIGV